MEQRHKKRLATCNSCTHFNEAARGNWFGYTPLCTDCPTQTGPNEYLDTGKTVTWVFNCPEALFCPNYEKADNYIERVRKGEILCRNGGPGYVWNAIYSDKEFYKTEFGHKMLRANLGLPEEPTKENTNKDSFAKKLDAKKKEDLRTIIYLRYQVKHGVSLEDALKNLGYKKEETSK